MCTVMFSDQLSFSRSSGRSGGHSTTESGFYEKSRTFEMNVCRFPVKATVCMQVYNMCFAVYCCTLDVHSTTSAWRQGHTDRAWMMSLFLLPNETTTANWTQGQYTFCLCTLKKYTLWLCSENWCVQLCFYSTHRRVLCVYCKKLCFLGTQNTYCMCLLDELCSVVYFTCSVVYCRKMCTVHRK